MINDKTKNIEVGEFYFVHDGSKTGHPGFVVWKDDKANRYLVVRFDSDKFDVELTKEQRKIKHITKLKHPTSNLVMNSYVHNRPMLCKRKDIGSKLSGLSISLEDMNIIETISKREPELSRSIK
mgnify:CR=1 FL=1